MFTLDSFSILAWDVGRNPEFLRERGPVAWSKHLQGFLNIDGLTRLDSLWHHVVSYCDYHCVDTRDRVFGLLSLTVEDSISPDYTKSTLQVLLQLLNQQAYRVRNPSTVSMEDVLCILRAFNLAPEIADMLRLRRSGNAAPRIPSRELVFNNQSQRQIVLESKVYCGVVEDDAGNMVTSKLKKSTPSIQSLDHGLQYIEQHAEDVAVKIRDPLGRVVALADKKVQAGDTLLFFTDRSPPIPFGSLVAGLIIRSTTSSIHVVVGQVIADHGIGFKNHTTPRGFEFSHQDWWVFMSPLDLLLFAAQDMKSDISSSGEGVVSSITRTAHPEEIVKRLTTSVTTDLNSSYAIRKEKRFGLALPINPSTIVLDRTSIRSP
jgi:hypothetical protein